MAKVRLSLLLHPSPPRFRLWRLTNYVKPREMRYILVYIGLDVLYFPPSTAILID